MNNKYGIACLLKHQESRKMLGKGFFSLLCASAPLRDNLLLFLLGLFLRNHPPLHLLHLLMVSDGIDAPIACPKEAA
jgi:hypothetical protein